MMASAAAAPTAAKVTCAAGMASATAAPMASAAAAAMPPAGAATPTTTPSKSYAIGRAGIYFLVEHVKGRQADVKYFLLGEMRVRGVP
jgi:hypothetical protein